MLTSRDSGLLGTAVCKQLVRTTQEGDLHAASAVCTTPRWVRLFVSPLYAKKAIHSMTDARLFEPSPRFGDSGWKSCQLMSRKYGVHLGTYHHDPQYPRNSAYFTSLKKQPLGGAMLMEEQIKDALPDFVVVDGDERSGHVARRRRRSQIP